RRLGPAEVRRGRPLGVRRRDGRGPGGVPISTEKKQRTWLQDPVSRRFAFSKPVSEGLIRELAFKNSYRELKAREIAGSDPKVLAVLDYRRLQEPVSRKIVVFFLVGLPIAGSLSSPPTKPAAHASRPLSDSMGRGIPRGQTSAARITRPRTSVSRWSRP